MYSPDMGDSGCGWWFDGWSRILSDSKGLTIGWKARDFPSLRDSKPAREPGVMFFRGIWITDIQWFSMVFAISAMGR
jgi:hypothetical protein